MTLGVVIEHLRGVRLRAPRSRLLLHRQKILGAVGNALKRTTRSVAFQLAIDVLRLAHGLLAQRKRQRVITRADPFHAIAEGASQLPARKFLGAQLGVQLADAGEEDVGSNFSHGLSLELECGLGGHRQRNPGDSLRGGALLARERRRHRTSGCGFGGGRSLGNRRTREKNAGQLASGDSHAPIIGRVAQAFSLLASLHGWTN